MINYPEPLRVLIQTLGQLPGIGPRSAERIALSLISWPRQRVEEFCSGISDATAAIGFCGTCGCIRVDDECRNCAALTESASSGAPLLCVVEKPTDVLSLQRFESLSGSFHVLGGKISPSSGIEPDDIAIESLRSRLEGLHNPEIVFALSSDVESEATIHFIKSTLSNTGGIRFTRMARGLPAGSSLEYTDEVTLIHAMENRVRVD